MGTTRGSARREFDRTRGYIAGFALSTPTIVSSANGSVVLTRATFGPFEGEILASRYTKIALNIGPSGWYGRRSENSNVDAPWPRNGLAVALPQEAAVGRSSAISMLGLAVDMDAMSAAGRTLPSIDALIPAASRLAVDPYAASLITTTWMSAETHGASTAFFEHALEELLCRVARIRTPAPRRRARPLARARLRQIEDLIEARLSADISVSDLAGALGMDTSSFTRAFQSSTGQAPFAYLTHRRMQRAKELLSKGQSVTATALSVGYANPSKFAAAFRRCVGCSPTEWLAA